MVQNRPFISGFPSVRNIKVELGYTIDASIYLHPQYQRLFTELPSSIVLSADTGVGIECPCYARGNRLGYH